MREPKRCEVCTAKIIRQYPANTCDSTCARASLSGRTRDGQITFEMSLDTERYEENHEAELCYREFDRLNEL